MERLKSMKETLIGCAQSQMGNLGQVDAHELGEVVDMIKDLDEAMYYCSVVKAMEESAEEKKYSQYQAPSNYYYTMPYYMNEDPREMDYYSGRMYYSGGSGSGSLEDQVLQVVLVEIAEARLDTLQVQAEEVTAVAITRVEAAAAVITKAIQ